MDTQNHKQSAIDQLDKTTGNETPLALPAPHRPWTRRLLWFFACIAAVSLLAAFMLWQRNQPTVEAFPAELVIEPGASVASIAKQAANRNIVSSALLLQLILRTQYDPTDIHAGRYVFSHPATLLEVARRIASNDTELDLIRITLPEGISNRQAARIVASTSPTISAASYAAAAAGQEGYLFPDTYLISPDMTAEELVALQQETLSEQLQPLQTAIASSSYTEAELLTLASIIEREANDETSMRTVAGILQNRLALGMPLQADATIAYALDTPLNELPPGQLATELRELDSPYNSYLYRGLPPTPIGNPGLQAITAVLNPIQTDYLYYITGTDGNFYYAETLARHNQNIAQYLR